MAEHLMKMLRFIHLLSLIITSQWGIAKLLMRKLTKKTHLGNESILKACETLNSKGNTRFIGSFFKY